MLHEESIEFRGVLRAVREALRDVRNNSFGIGDEKLL